jgi:predicted nucleic acid-binding protein
MGGPSIYADTSFLVSHFVNDGNTDAARFLISGLGQPLMISPLGRLEYRGAMWQRVGRGEFEPSHARRACLQFQEQEKLGWFIEGVVDEQEVWRRAVGLTEQFTASLKVRSLDIWHVAFALEAGVERLWTFDHRQETLARAVGLKVNL